MPTSVPQQPTGGHTVPAAASALLAPLLDGPARALREVVRTRVSVHYATGDPVLPLLCVATPDAVRLPLSLVSPTLPGDGVTTLGGGILGSTTSEGSVTWRVTRWWRPPRPTGLAPPPRPADCAAALARHAGWAPGHRDPGDPVPPLLDAHGLDPHRLVGRGPGLTPTGDDVLAAALVTARATGDPRLPGWAAATRVALARQATTPVSHGLLLAALDGWCTPELSAFLGLVCSATATDEALASTADRLLAVGHSSGAALALGVLHTLTTQPLRGAA